MKLHTIEAMAFGIDGAQFRRIFVGFAREIEALG
jgi:hypothetical protein